MSETCTICHRDGLNIETAVALKAGFRHAECPALPNGDFHPFECHEMPNGSVVFYRDADHRYYTEVAPVLKGRGEKKAVVAYAGIKSAEIPSPSAIAKFADPNPDMLMGWSAKREREGMGLMILEIIERTPSDALADALTWVESPDESGALLADNKLTWRHLRDQKGDDGSITHRAWENALQDRDTDWTQVPHSAQGYVKGALGFLTAHDFETLQQEAVVYSQEHGFAGRFDARVRNRATGEVWLLDLKTSGYIGRSYHEQLHAYDLAAEECGIGASDKLFIVQVTDEGKFTAWPVRASRQAFLNSLAKYHDGRATDRATRADYRELAA